MKTQDIVTCLIFITGVGCIENFVEVGKEYEYEYDGRIMSGIPTMSPQFAGVYIQAKLILQVYPNNWFHLFVKDVQYKSFNEKFQAKGDIYWKNLKLKSNQTMSADSTIEKPIKFTLRNGELSEIIVSENEAEWELNFKKALVSMIKIQEPKPNFSRSNSIRRDVEGNDEPESTWTVMEQGVDGVCENRYHYSQVAGHLIPDMVETFDLKYNCKNENMYEIIKTRDYNSCLNRTAYNVNQHGVYMCRKGTCAPNWQRSALTRYLTCGNDYKTSKLLYIISEGEIQQKLLNNQDKANFAGTLQTLKFVEERNSFSELNDIYIPRMIQNILYEYTKLTTIENGRSERSVEETSIHDANLLNKNHTKVSPLYKLTPKSLEEKILFDLMEIFKKINDSEWDTDHFVANSLLSISDLLSLLEEGNMKDLLYEIRDAPNLRDNAEKKNALEAVYLDTVLMTGTNQALNFLMDIIRSEELSSQQVLFILVSLPHYMQTPSADIVHNIFQLLKSEVISGNKIIKANADIAFAEILHKACINPKRHQNYPIYIMGDFCDVLTQSMNDEYLPYFVDTFKSATDDDMKVAAVLSMNALAHPSMMMYIEPILKGNDCSQSEQIMALLSLKPEKYANAGNLKRLLESVIFFSEPVIAKAALMPYLSMDLKVSDLRRLEFLIHFSKDSEISSYLSVILHKEYNKSESKINRNVYHGFTEAGFTEGLEETKDDPMVRYSREIAKEDNFHSNQMEILYKLHPSKKFHVWMKIFDNLQVFLWPEGSFTRDPIAYALDALDLKSHRYGLIKIFDSKPNEVIIPSEIGLPYLLEVHSPMVANLKMDNTGYGIEIKSIQVETGYLGTICPFTRRILAAGVDSQTVQKMHLSINHTLTKSYIDDEIVLDLGLLAKWNIKKSRKIAYTSAKELGLLNIVHSVMDKNTLQIQDQLSSQGKANDNTEIVEKFFSRRITFNERTDKEPSPALSTAATKLKKHVGHHCRTYREHFLLRPSNRQTCFSKARFLKCGAGCAQGDLQWKNIHFICYENTNIDQQASRSKSPGISMRTRIQVPGICRPL